MDMSSLLPLIVVRLGHGVEYYCWAVTVVTAIKLAREGVHLDS